MLHFIRRTGLEKHPIGAGRNPVRQNADRRKPGHNSNAGLRAPAPYFAIDFHAAGVRHASIEREQVRAQGFRHGNGFETIFGLANNFHIWKGCDQVLQTATYQSMIVGNDDFPEYSR